LGLTKTFKTRLRAAQQASGRSDWAALLLEIVFTINTTISQALLYNKTLFEVWFGRKPCWIGQLLLLDSDEESDDTDFEATNVEDLKLSAIEVQVAKNNLKLCKQCNKCLESLSNK
jgi:hypothetical protein